MSEGVNQPPADKVDDKEAKMESIRERIRNIAEDEVGSSHFSSSGLEGMFDPDHLTEQDLEKFQALEAGTLKNEEFKQYFDKFRQKDDGSPEAISRRILLCYINNKLAKQSLRMEF